MKVSIHTANKTTTFFVYCDIYLRKSFDISFFRNINYIDYKTVFNTYRPVLEKNLFFSYLKALAFDTARVNENEDIAKVYENFKTIDLNIWKQAYEQFNDDEKFNVNVANTILLQYFGYTLDGIIDVVLVPKNTHDDLRMHSGVTNSREKDLIFMFVPEYKEGVPYKRLSLEVLLHEIIHLYIYRSEWYARICTLAVAQFGNDENKIEGICNELLARVFLAPNIFGLVRSVFGRNVLAEHPLHNPLNITAHAILQNILDTKIETIDDTFVKVFLDHLGAFLNTSPK